MNADDAKAAALTSRGLRALDHLGEAMYQGWVRTAIMIALAGYLAITAVDVLLFDPGERVLAMVSQGLTVLACAVALLLSFRGRCATAATITLTAIWVELQVGIPVTGMQTAGLIAYPVLVSGAGILLGGRAGFYIAGLTTVSLAILGVTGLVLRPEQVATPAQSAYLLAVTAASMFAAAALVRLGLDSLSRVLLSARASEQRLTDLLAHAPDGILATDSAGRILSANPAAERLLGRDPGELEGRDLAGVLRAAMSMIDDPAHLDALLDAGGDKRTVPIQLRGRGGAVHSLDAETGPVVWADGTRGRQVTLRDVTERREAEESQRLLRVQLEHAQRLEAVGRLAGGVAHEFNNLLTIVGGAAEMLLAETKGVAHSLATDILEAKVRGAALTKQLLAFARKDLIQPRRISLAAVARDMEVLLGRFVTEKVRFSLDIPTEVPLVVADRAQVEQIIVNLVINAKDAINGEGFITVGVYPEGTERAWCSKRWTVDAGWVELAVVDNGHGMDPLTLERAFEPFFSTKPRGRGTGLGLATVHGTTIQNGGRIQIHSERGVGTAVIVNWPVVARG